MSPTAPPAPLSRRLFPFLSWPRLDLALLRRDGAAGLAVGLVAVPQAVAYAGLAGMPVVTGIYASFLPSLVAALFSATPRVSVGPTALTCLLVFASLSGLADPGSAQWVGLAVWLALLSGLMQVAMGAGRLGWVLQLVTAPVLTGFTQAAAVLIIASQLPTLLGVVAGVTAGGPVDGSSGLTWITNLAPFGMAQSIDLRSAAFGLGALALLVVGKRVAPNFPMVMLVVVGAGVLSGGLGFGAAGGAIIGALPSGLPSFQLPPAVSFATLGVLVFPAAVIALVSFLETASSAKVDNQRRRQPWNDNQDLIAQGLAKLSSGLIGSFPTSSSFSRSALNLYAGAQSGWSAVVLTVAVQLVLLWFTPALSVVPKAILAAVVVGAVWGLLKPGQFVRLWQVSRAETFTAAVTFVVTIVSAPRIYWGVLAGVGVGLMHFLIQRLHPRIIEIGLHADGSLRDRHLWHLPPLAPQLYAVRMDAALDFASATSLERNITEHLNAHASAHGSPHPSIAHVCLFAQPINHIDATGVEVFGQLRRALADRHVTLHISGIKLPVEAVLRRAGELPDPPAVLPYLRLYRTDAETLLRLSELEHRVADDPTLLI